jgi:hypothetical protein
MWLIMKTWEMADTVGPLTGARMKGSPVQRAGYAESKGFGEDEGSTCRDVINCATSTFNLPMT